MKKLLSILILSLVVVTSAHATWFARNTKTATTIAGRPPVYYGKEAGARARQAERARGAAIEADARRGENKWVIGHRKSKHHLAARPTSNKSTRLMFDTSIYE